MNPVVRLSHGHFDPEKYEEVSRTLEAWRGRLHPALETLRGLRHYYVAVDSATHAMVNISVWDTLEDAQQMSTLSVMLEQRGVFEALGVRFDPIANFHTLWAVTP